MICYRPSYLNSKFSSDSIKSKNQEKCTVPVESISPYETFVRLLFGNKGTDPSFTYLNLVHAFKMGSTINWDFTAQFVLNCHKMQKHTWVPMVPSSNNIVKPG